MKQTDVKQAKFGIAVKTSTISGVIVLILLLIASIALMKFESHLTGMIFDEYVQKVENTIDGQGEKQKKSLINNFKVNAKIIAGISAPFLYNVDAEGLQGPLETYMELGEVLAIKVVDAEGSPFFAIWKGPEVITDQLIPEEIILDESLSSKAQALIEEDNVGFVQIYYTDTLLSNLLLQDKKKVQSEISLFRLSVDKNIQNAFVAQGIVVFFIILILVTTIVMCIKFLTIFPVNRITNSLKDIAEGKGDLTKRLEVKTMDEVGVLASWFNVFIEKLQIMIKEVAGNANTLTNSSSGLLKLSADMSKGALYMTDISNNVSSASKEMSSNMGFVSSSMDQSSNSVEVVLKSIVEMNETINAIAGNTTKSRDIVDQAVSKAKVSSEKIEDLGKAIFEISKVSETITDISGQTNLLALNATIEAARAGEAGKGFAVVANEIKELSKQTADATKEIKRVIEIIQTTIKGAVSENSQVALIINDINELISVIATAIEEQSASTGGISENLEQVSQSIQEVNSNVAESTSVALDITKDIAGVNVESQDISNSSSQINLSAEDLLNLATKLNMLVGQFKV